MRPSDGGFMEGGAVTCTDLPYLPVRGQTWRRVVEEARKRKKRGQRLESQHGNQCRGATLSLMLVGLSGKREPEITAQLPPHPREMLMCS